MASGYLIRGGDVYDGNRSHAVAADIRIAGSKIVEIGRDLPLRGEILIDAAGMIVTPGLIDLHAHVYSGMGQFSVDPDQAGLRTGVTTILDTGTAGALTYGTFDRFVIPSAREDIYTLLHISRIGVLQNHTLPPHSADLSDERYIHVPSAIECIEKYGERIIGTKVRLTAALADNREKNERLGLIGAVEVAAKTARVCMVHHVLSQIPLSDVLEALRPGDIYTHVYHPNPDNGLLAPGGPAECLLRARDRGILFDVGHGSGSFGWDLAELACQKYGFWPDTISTDIHQYNLNGPVFDLPTTMSKFLHLGMPLADVIRATTSAAADAMRLGDRFGRLAVGRQADITLLRLIPDKTELTDVKGCVRIATQRLVPVGGLKRGETFGSQTSGDKREAVSALADCAR